MIACLLVTWGAGTATFANDASPDQVAQAEFFERKIRPLFAKHCYDCHVAETADENGKLALDGRAGLLAGGTRGPILVAGKPDESLLISALRYADPKLQMPPDGKLADTDINLLVQWIQQGAVIPEYGEANQKKSKEIDWATVRQFWSFQPLRNVAIPSESVEHAAAIQQPVDAFVHRSLKEHDLEPASAADRRTLIRRLAFDVLGLPPTPEDVAQFQQDESPDAYERLVDRLLASPHFGERWARYWLDLVRYTDVTPTWLKNADQAWLYRDWVVRALNADLPYPQFVQQQLAADVIENTPPEDYAALGLIGLSPTYWKELQLAPGVIEVIVADEWDERIDAVTRTFLGLTVACARCHDHKFDPITSRDYYALAGVFASTQLSDRPLLPSPQAEQIADARKQVDKLEEALKAIADKTCEEAKKLTTDIENIKSGTPQFSARMAHTVEEASIFVLPDGPDKTMLDVRKGQSRDLPVFRRGNPANTGEIVPRRFIEVLSPGSPTNFRSGSGRRELVDAFFHESRGLTSRVMVNRIWSHHFGRGIVRTPSDFGVQGDRPSHPELLEWLASAFARDDQSVNPRQWKFKWLHRQMVTSNTYRQSSETPNESALSAPASKSVRLDPENQWLGRMSRRRLDVEPWRDAMLAAAGILDDTLGGPARELDQPGNLRRTLYGRVGRDEQNDMLRLFDFPPPTSHSPGRDPTTTPLQQLFILNSDFVESQAKAVATNVLTRRPEGTRPRVTLCYELVFQRAPTERELQLAEQFLATSTGDSTGEAERWPLYVQSLFGLNELLYID